MKHAPVPTPQNLADALGDVRAEIRALRAREAALREALIDARPNGPVCGQRYEVSIRQDPRRVFDRDSLPDAIFHDDRFWMTRVSQTVVTRALEVKSAIAARTGAVPMPAAPACAATLDLWGHDTDLVLIEDC